MDDVLLEEDPQERRGGGSVMEHFMHIFTPGTEENLALIAIFPFLPVIKMWVKNFFSR